MKLFNPTVLFLVAFATVMYPGCASKNHFSSSDRAPQSEEDSTSTFVYKKPVTPHLCAALRGNGTRIFATIESLAEITEHMGPIDGVAGASSGGAASFLYESMLLNPAVRSCRDNDQGRRVCTPAETGRRVSLLLRSFPGYMTTLATKTEQKSLFAAESLGNIKTEGLTWEDIVRGEAALGTLFGDPDINQLINPEIRSMAKIKNVLHARTAFNRIMAATKEVDIFNANNTEAIFRPGLIKIEQLATLVSRAGNFYANYQPQNTSGNPEYWNLAAWSGFLDDCTPGESSPDLGWDQISKMPKGDSKSCQNALDDLIVAYRKDLMTPVQVQVNGRNVTTTLEFTMNPSRRTDLVGKAMHSINSVSSLWKKGIGKEFQKQLDAYLNFQTPVFKPSVSDFRISYFGDDKDLAMISKTLPATYAGDEKSEKFHALPHFNWVQAMTRSASEPGLSHALPIDEDTLTFGGWIDPHATLVLRAIGCENVVYVTRSGTESDFAVTASILLGSTTQDRANISSLARTDPFDRKEIRSSFAKSLNEADAVWCTNWDHAGGTDIAAQTHSARQAIVVINDFSRAKTGTDVDTTLAPRLFPKMISNGGQNKEGPSLVYQSEVLGHPNAQNSGYTNKQNGPITGLYGCVDGAPLAPNEAIGEQDKTHAARFEP